MLPILPRLAAELQLDQDDKRLSALQLIGKLLAQPDSDIEASHFGLVEEFTNRAVDQKVMMRNSPLQCKLCPIGASVSIQQSNGALQILSEACWNHVYQTLSPTKSQL